MKPTVQHAGLRTLRQTPGAYPRLDGQSRIPEHVRITARVLRHDVGAVFESPRPEHLPHLLLCRFAMDALGGEMPRYVRSAAPPRSEM